MGKIIDLVLYHLNNVVSKKLDWGDHDTISFYDLDIPGYNGKEMHVNIWKENGIYSVGVEDLIESETSDTYLIPIFSIGTVSEYNKTLRHITRELDEKELEWIWLNLVQNKYDVNINNLEKDKTKYVAYLTSLDSSAIVFSRDFDFLKSQWCFGMKIFEAGELKEETLKELFPDKPEQGTILKWLEENKKEVYSEGWLSLK